ncbi:hypothetical protein Hbl1158_16900 (plasmid) [Halobaculum sp. CBA1158]|uniref:hypothetical protein n=1 Tax=Halobaculum sp. CBA1158 TaxID=2904243 RepID=UPI001F31AD3D|nr:hypothetical protein [Halobaculum sp. CBA1158]UIP01733.1 hypothetical protein Hbl1158_16900 [Halobaculum sp. CBA1158]
MRSSSIALILTLLASQVAVVVTTPPPSTASVVSIYLSTIESFVFNPLGWPGLIAAVILIFRFVNHEPRFTGVPENP